MIVLIEVKRILLMNFPNVSKESIFRGTLAEKRAFEALNDPEK